jgi:hypothetical protein
MPNLAHLRAVSGATGSPVRIWRACHLGSECGAVGDDVVVRHIKRSLLRDALGGE